MGQRNLGLASGLMALIACTGGKKADDSGDTDTPPAMAVEDAAIDCSLSEQPAGVYLTASAGRISVVDVDVLAGCCPAGVAVGLDVTGEVITPRYTPGADPCDCVCGLDTTYTITNVPAGTWTVDDGSHQSTATVP